jgi:hypothetical protein
MIKLIDLLNEGKQVGTLYHFTNSESLSDILKNNTLEATYGDYGKTNHKAISGASISFTRSPNRNNFPLAVDSDCVLVIDGNKLSNNYKIIPYSEQEAEFDEMEERIYNKNIINLNKYLLKVVMFEDNKQVFGEDMWNECITLLKEKNIPYEIIK